ncbi:helix-turn-helix domain-containing protein [Flavobacterium alkalisoli]|uniref:helix-turn-helix domain-containing protein n=1 Tax=Flavobacterium alkalisoli TaxID=2602769 RepID=UPI00143E0401|nr:AraC family transcriptional regulator [Flavobacterium alkalisoli]
MLAIFYFLIAYQSFITILITTRTILDYPHFYRTGYISLLVSTPLAYLFIESVLTGKNIDKADFLHFIPALVYIIDYLPLFLLDAAEKQTWLSDTENYNNTLIMFSESVLFPQGFYTALNYIQSLTYWILQCILIYRFISKNNIDAKKNIWLRWLTLFMIAEAFTFIPPFALLTKGDEFNPILLFLYIGGGTGLTSIMIFLFPKILYGVENLSLDELKLIPVPEYKARGTLETVEPENKGVYLSEERLAEIERLIDSHFFSSEKPFLRPHYTLNEISRDLGIPTQYLSMMFNSKKNVKYNDYINALRVQHTLDLIGRDMHRSHTLEGIAKLSGFSNRNTFTTAFKKFTGQRPKEYLKDLQAYDK